MPQLLILYKLSKLFIKKPHPFSLQKIPVYALQDVSVTLNAGYIYGIVGKTGSGKTTLGKILCGMLGFEQGGVHWDLQVVKKPTDVQMIFQNAASSLNPRLTLEEILREPLVNLHVPRDEQKDRILAYFNKVGLPDDILSVYSDQISGGQRQKVCIVRALLIQPKVLVCDEIISHLDLDSQVSILNLLKQLRQAENLSIIFISHDLRTVYNISDTVLVIHEGRLVKVLDKKTSSYNDLSGLFESFRH